ncbi:hypothetical protein ABH935_007538 [Catenulispora sp. GAS73]
MTSQGDAVRLSPACCAGGWRFRGHDRAHVPVYARVALAAGGFRGHDHAHVPVYARVALAAGGLRGHDHAHVPVYARVALAAGGLRGHDHAWVRVTAHTLRRRQSSCVVGTLRPPAGALQRGGDPRDLLDGGGPRLVGFLSAVACVALVGGGRCLWSPGSVPLATSSPYGTSPVRRRQAASHLLWYSLARLDTTEPGRLASPADAARGTEPTPRMVRSDTTHHVAGGGKDAGPGRARSAVGAREPEPLQALHDLAHELCGR